MLDTSEFLNGLDAVSAVLPIITEPGVIQVGLEEEQEFPPFFGGGGKIPVETQVISDRGLKRRYELAPADSTVNIGVVSRDKPLSRLSNLPWFTNLRIKPSLVPYLETTVQFDQTAEDYIKNGGDAGITDAAEYLLRTGLRQSLRKTQTLMLADRRAILGTVIDVTIADGDPNDWWVVTLELGVDAIPLAFLPGALLQVGRAPAFGAAVFELRNFSQYLKVVGRFNAAYNAATGTCLTVTCIAPYTVGTKDDIKTELDTIIATDVVGPWAGATADEATMPVGGFNYGLAGLRHHTETDGAGVFADIEDVGGATAEGLVTDEDTPRAVSRADLEFAEILNPIVVEGAAAAVGTMRESLDSIFLQLSLAWGKEVDAMVLVNPLSHKALRESIGQEGLRTNESLSDEMRQRFVKWGCSGFAYEGESATVIPVGKTWALPADMVLVSIGSPFELLSVRPAGWLPGWRGVFRQQLNTDAVPLHGWEATFQLSQQLWVKKVLSKSLAVIRNTVPAAA